MKTLEKCFYGPQLWDLSNNCIDRLCIFQRKSNGKTYLSELLKVFLHIATCSGTDAYEINSIIIMKYF